MEFIGHDRQPAPLLKDVSLTNPRKVYVEIIDAMKKMFSQAELIHSDLSPFNILFHNDKPVIIDLGQAVLKSHPRAAEFLRRDIHTITKYFKRYKIDMLSEEELFKKIITDNE